MKNIYIYLVIPAWIILSFTTSYAQGNTTPQPKIIVVPKIKPEQTYRGVYDSVSYVRTAIAKISEALLKRGANLVSFDAKYKQYKENAMLRKSAGHEEDVKTRILQLASADIYVEAEVNTVSHDASSTSSINIILEAYQAGTGNYLGVKEGRSRIVETQDYALLTSLAMDEISTDFLNMIQQKFNDIHENGQSVYVEFTISADSDLSFDSEMGSQHKMLSEIINDWFEKKAVKGVFNNQGVVANMLIISDVRIPLKNPANPQSNYSGQNFYSEIYNFLKTIGIKAAREIGNNNKIIITLNKA